MSRDFNYKLYPLYNNIEVSQNLRTWLCLNLLNELSKLLIYPDRPDLTSFIDLGESAI